MYSPLPYDKRPYILFRVEYSGNSSFQDFDMVARDPNVALTPVVFDQHLSWNRISHTPFLSFFSNWAKALRWRKQLLDQGKRDVVVIAVWARDLDNCYKAEDIATTLGYNNSGQDRRRRLSNHRYEYLVCGGIAADDYQILAEFPGDGPEISVTLRSRTITVNTSLPGDFARNTPPQKVSEELLKEIYCGTGDWDVRKYNELISCMGGI